MSIVRPLLHGDAEDGLLGAAGPLVDGVDRVARRDQADIADRDRHLVAADFAGDRLQCGDRQPLGLLIPGAVRRPHPELEPPGVDPGEDLQAERSSHQHDHRERAGEVSRHDHPAPTHDGARRPGRSASRPRSNRESPALFPRSAEMVMVAQQPGRQDRHERAGEEIRSDHGEADGQRQRDEERLGRSLHEERRNEDRQHAEHRQQPGDGRLLVAAPDRAGDGATCLPSGGGCSRPRPWIHRPGCRWPAPGRPGSSG